MYYGEINPNLTLNEFHTYKRELLSHKQMDNSISFLI